MKTAKSSGRSQESARCFLHKIFSIPPFVYPIRSARIAGPYVVASALLGKGEHVLVCGP